MTWHICCDTCHGRNGENLVKVGWKFYLGPFYPLSRRSAFSSGMVDQENFVLNFNDVMSNLNPQIKELYSQMSFINHWLGK